jgi:hypothetical protein
MWRQSAYNDMVIGFRHLVGAHTLIARLLGAPYQLQSAASLALHLRAVAPSSHPLTDDQAPVEWMTDQMIIKYVSAH